MPPKHWQQIRPAISCSLRAIIAFVAFTVMWAFLQRALDGFGVAWVLNTKVLWPSFGMPTDAYSFRAVFLPRMIAQPFASFPSFLTGLVVFRFIHLTNKLLIATTTIVLIFGAFCLTWMANQVSQPTNQTFPSPYWSLLLVHYAAAVSLIDLYFLTLTANDGKEC